MVLQNQTLCLIRKGEDCNAAPIPRQGKKSSEKHCFWILERFLAVDQKTPCKDNIFPTFQKCYNRASSAQTACHCQIFLRFWGPSIL
jgi:hypothetical protein